MSELHFDLPEDKSSIIKVVGVGGGGSNAVNHMYKQGIKDVNFVVCNTDAQALAKSPIPVKIQLGSSLTEGRGAGNKPEIGRQAAIENLDDVIRVLSDSTKMVFITAGMGGGTGTGAAPVIAKAAKEMGILTVAIVTLPFRFEGQRRINQAVQGIKEISEHVDSLLVVNNEKLREVSGDLPVTKAFSSADDILTIAAKGIAEIITVTGHVNVDFADVQTVMTNSGVALMGSASAEGPDRAIRAISSALNSPLLNSSDIRGARNILLNIISGTDEVTMDEIAQINEYVQDAAGNTADLIWGNTSDEKLGEKISVTVIATGFKTDIMPDIFPERQVKTTVDLKDKPEPKKRDDEMFVVLDTNKQTSFASEGSARKEVHFEVVSDTTTFIVEDSSQTKKEVETDTVQFTENTQAKASERMETIKKAVERKNEISFDPAKYSENVDALENEPAFKRRNVVIPDRNYSSANDVSNMTISTDKDKGPRLRSSGNPYLYDNVD